MNPPKQCWADIAQEIEEDEAEEALHEAEIDEAKEEALKDTLPN